MKELTPDTARIREIVSNTIDRLSLIEPAAHEYGTLINHSQTDHFFFLPKVEKKELSHKYFHFSIKLCDIIQTTDHQMMELTDISLSADRHCSQDTIGVCHKALLAYMTLQEDVSHFSTHTEALISAEATAPLQELDMTLRQLLFRIRHTCDELRAIIAELS